DDPPRELLEITQHWRRDLDHLDLALELRPELLQRDCVLGVEVRTAIGLDGSGGVVEHPLKVDRERVVRLLVEAKIERATGLVPPRIVGGARGILQPKLHVVMWPNPFAGVDDAALERGIDLAARG